MDTFFLDLEEKRVPPQDTRILDLQAVPSPDGARFQVNIVLTPFLKRPEIDLELENLQGQVCASTTIIEPVSSKIELILHLRSQTEPEKGLLPGSVSFRLSAILSYPDLGEVDHRVITVDVSPH